MKWVNHIAIAGSVAAVIKPELVPVAIAGATAPDWLEWVLKACGQRIRHRTVTHYVSTWCFGLLFGLMIWDFHGIITAFCLGGLLHVFTDALTVSGVPLGWWSDQRFHLFGGRLRTGQPGEYLIAGAVVVVCAVIGWQTKSWSNSFYPFFYDWHGLYQEGVIDASEWKANRFRWL